MEHRLTQCHYFSLENSHTPSPVNVLLPSTRKSWMLEKFWFSQTEFCVAQVQVHCVNENGLPISTSSVLLDHMPSFMWYRLNIGLCTCWRSNNESHYHHPKTFLRIDLFCLLKIDRDGKTQYILFCDSVLYKILANIQLCCTQQ